MADMNIFELVQMAFRRTKYYNEMFYQSSASHEESHLHTTFCIT